MTTSTNFFPGSIVRSNRPTAGMIPGALYRVLEVVDGGWHRIQAIDSKTGEYLAPSGLVDNGDEVFEHANEAYDFMTASETIVVIAAQSSGSFHPEADIETIVVPFTDETPLLVRGGKRQTGKVRLVSAMNPFGDRVYLGVSVSRHLQQIDTSIVDAAMKAAAKREVEANIVAQLKGAN